MSRELINLVGLRFHKLKVLKRVDPYISKNKKKQQVYLCLCDCGNYKEIRMVALQTNATKSCGCFRKSKLSKLRKTHGLWNTDLYWVWANMMQRCYNPKRKEFKDYGGRGITVCKEWQNNPEKFIKWSSKNGYKKGLYIDREDNDLLIDSYNPDNCRFVTAKVSVNNRRCSRRN